MITWLQNFFLKHNKWLFGGLLVVIIVTFVLTIGPQSFFGSGGQQQRKALRFHGYDLSSEADQRALIQSAEISAYLHPDLQVRNDQLTDYAYMRVTALGMASQLGIPNPTKEDLSAFMETVPAFQNPQTGEFSADAYQALVNALNNSDRYPKGFLNRVFREDYQIKKVREALSGPDYYLPFEAEFAFKDNETSYDVAIASLDYATFEPEVSLEDETLEQFFNENPARYEVPVMMETTALQFNMSSYMDEVPEATEAELQAYFARNKARYESARETPEDTEETEELPELTLEDVREDVIRDLNAAQARRIAAKKGEQFSVRLWQDGIELDSDEFNELIEEFAVTKVDVPPYSRNGAVQSNAATPQLFQSMWIYADNPTRYFSDIASTVNGAVVLVKTGVTEARMPAFEEVREAVVRDYTAQEKRRLFAEKGETLRTALEASLAEGKSFSEAAEAVDLQASDLESFKGANVPSELRSANLWEQVQFLESGEITPMVLQQNKGTFVYLKNKDVPEVDTTSEAYTTFIAQRSGALSDSMGWARLRELTDEGLNNLLGQPE